MKIKTRKARYKAGQHLLECDLSGRIMYSGDSVKLWNGLIVHKDYYEERNPQDFIQSRPERQTVKDARPRRTATYIPITGDDL